MCEETPDNELRRLSVPKKVGQEVCSSTNNTRAPASNASTTDAA